MARINGLIFGVVIFALVSSGHCHDGHDHHDHNNGDKDEFAKAHHVALKVFQGVDLRWLSTSEENVTMEMKAFTKGYVSIGFCPEFRGSMEGCDIVIGWVDNHDGKPHLYDYYAKGNTLPELDQSQDYELLDGRQERGMTTIRFRRRWATDDPKDANLESGKVRVMWAWHPEDPSSPTTFLKHAGASRGHMESDISVRHPDMNALSEHYHSGVGGPTQNIFIFMICLSILVAKRLTTF